MLEKPILYTILLIISLVVLLVPLSQRLSWPPRSTAQESISDVSIQGGLYFQNNTSDNVWVAVGYADVRGTWFSP